MTGSGAGGGRITPKDLEDAFKCGPCYKSPVTCEQKTVTIEKETTTGSKTYTVTANMFPSRCPLKRNCLGTCVTSYNNTQNSTCWSPGFYLPRASYYNINPNIWLNMSFLNDDCKKEAGLLFWQRGDACTGSHIPACPEGKIEPKKVNVTYIPPFYQNKTYAKDVPSPCICYVPSGKSTTINGTTACTGNICKSGYCCNRVFQTTPCANTSISTLGG